MWHVDDLKLPHVDPDEITGVLKQLNDVYGQDIVDEEKAEITITWGKLHDYLGMILDYNEDGCVKIDMVEYVNKWLVDLPENMKGKARTPAADDLFIIDVDSKLLDQNHLISFTVKLPNYYF